MKKTVFTMILLLIAAGILTARNDADKIKSDIDAYVVEKALKLLETHEPAPLAADVAARIDALVAGFTPEG